MDIDQAAGRGTHFSRHCPACVLYLAVAYIRHGVRSIVLLLSWRWIREARCTNTMVRRRCCNSVGENRVIC